ncbi:hypothetical protein DIC66_17740 [Rhodoferax lacus]|uniref:DUF2189 domain-containing protein n=1 Tax=Rhodoferax lacus TaxID=2184758 RepID=A0A3E1R8E3_9BURK|nr:DUF2189 domain-containing protein [Rhodoferax lacus]RFO95639.1 hypothetical protein DIC66_17740 [Rhodoferax lacus]
MPTHSIPSVAPKVKTIGMMQPLVWLVQAWSDIVRSGWISILHGVVLTAAGIAIVAFARHRFWLLAGALSGFMVIAPVLATSLYALSRAIERREKPNFSVVLKTWLNWQNSHFNKWDNDYWCMVQFGLLLAAAATGWVLTSAALITLMAPVPINSPLDFVHHVMLAPDSWLFEIWLALGGVMAAPLFASSVVAMPLLLDRRVTLLQAVLTSWQTVLANPMPMAFWASIIMIFTLLGLGSLFLGLIPVLPMLGHASWHAYHDLVDASELPAREPFSAPDSQFGTP